MDPGKDYPGLTFCAPDPKIYLPGPFYPGHPDYPDWLGLGPDPIIPPVKCSRAPDPDGPGQVNVLYARAPDPDGPGQVNVRCGPFRPIPPVKCGPKGGPIGDPPMHPEPDYPMW